MKKELKELQEWFNKNKTYLTYSLVGLIIGIGITCLFMPKRIAKLKDGSEPIVTLDEFTITADDYYNELKEVISTELISQLIDTKLLDEIYPTTDDIRIEILQKTQDTINEYTNYYKYDEKTFLSENGFNSRDELYELLLLNYKRDLYYQEYVRNLIQNNEINNYYIKSVNADMEIKYITTTDIDVMNKIITDLKNGKTYENIVNSYKKNITYKDMSYVSFDTDIDSKIYEEALTMKASSASSTYIVTDDNAYAIIFKGNVKEKDSIENIKSRIIEILKDKKIAEDTDSKIFYQSLNYLRNSHHLTFNDTVLKNKYDIFMKSYQ